MFLGRSDAFPQRHFSWTKSHYCPSWLTRKADGLVRSPVSLDDIREDVMEFNGPTVPRFKDDTLDSVIASAAQRFRLPKQVHPIHLNDLPDMDLDTWNSSPGLPWKAFGYANKREVAKDPRAFKSIRKIWHLVKEGKKISLPDCAAFVRPHLVEKGEKKVRAVWGYPATVSFQEACFALPLINAYKNNNSPIAYGFDTARGGCRKLFMRFCRHKFFLSADFKSFDKYVPAWLIRVAFDILLINIDFRKYQDRGIPDADKISKAWFRIVDYFINTPIRLCNGERYRKRRGVASGSYFTQLIDSIVNWIVIQYSLRKSGVLPKDHLVMGDDSLVAIDKDVDLKSLTSYVRRFGMKLNTEKTALTRTVQKAKFLGYYINTGNPSRKERDLYAALVHPERPDRSFDEFATRALGLLISNFGEHIEFDNCCRAILSAPFKLSPPPSLIRFLKIIGIDQLPKEPPDRFRLQLWRYRT